MFANRPIRELIRTGETAKIGGQIRKEAGEGMIPLDESLFKMWIAKRITYNDMMRNGLDTGKVEQWVRRYTEDMRGRGREGPPPDEDCRRWTGDDEVPPEEGV